MLRDRETPTVEGDAFIVLFDLLPATRYLNLADRGVLREALVKMPTSAPALVIGIKEYVPRSVQQLHLPPVRNCGLWQT